MVSGEWRRITRRAPSLLTRRIAIFRSVLLALRQVDEHFTRHSTTTQLAWRLLMASRTTVSITCASIVGTHVSKYRIWLCDRNCKSNSMHAFDLWSVPPTQCQNVSPSHRAGALWHTALVPGMYTHWSIAWCTLSVRQARVAIVFGGGSVGGKWEREQTLNELPVRALP